MSKELMHHIIDKIEEYDTIALYRHVYPDPDSYGAQVGLKNIIEKTFPGKVVYLMGKHDERLAYIGEMDDPSTVKLDASCLAIILDVSDAPRVDDQSFKTCGYTIKIDHHRPFEEGFEDLGWVDTHYPATCMMLTDLLLETEGRLKIEKKGREVLYIGIVADTGRFVYLPNPTSVFEKLPQLTYDLDTKPLYDAYYEKELKEVEFLGYIYSNFKILEPGVAVLKIPKDVLKQYNMDYMVAARMVRELQNIKGLMNWHFFAEKPETGEVVCEFRSNGPAVNTIAAKYGGGGHHCAAGATVAGWEVVELIIKDCVEACQAYEKEQQ